MEPRGFRECKKLQMDVAKSSARFEKAQRIIRSRKYVDETKSKTGNGNYSKQKKRMNIFRNCSCYFQYITKRIKYHV